jgi:hypothetical protein
MLLMGRAGWRHQEEGVVILYPGTQPELTGVPEVLRRNLDEVLAKSFLNKDAI